jgi:hypothetical protein
MLVKIAQALYDQNSSVDLCDVHLGDGTSMPGGCQSLRCLTADGRDVMRSGTGGPYFR